MKKLIILIITFCFIINFNCFATEKTYSLNDGKMSLTFNDDNFDFVYANGDISIANPDFSFETILQTNDDDYKEMLDERNLKFDAANFYDLSEIYVQIIENDFSKSTFDLNNYTEYELSNLINGSDFKEGLKDIGLSDVDISIQKINDTIYLNLTGKTDNMFATSYFTVKDGKSISVALNSLDAESYYKYNSLLMNIVNSIEFEKSSSLNSSNNIITSSEVAGRIITAAIGGGILGIIATSVSKVKNKKTKEKQKDLFED